MAPTVPVEYTGQRELTLCSRKELGHKMGKSRKVSKGYSSGFVPDYRHAVETIAESEGFGSSGRVDMEMTVSENSYAPKRKAISSNGQVDYGRFGVPFEFFSLSKMSRSDRKDLELRFQNELEQVRSCQRRITSFSMNSIMHSPATDIHDSNGLKRPPFQNPQRPVKEAPGRNGTRPKGGPKQGEPLKPNLPPNTNNAMLMKQCETLLKRLMEQEFGWVFNTPVDPVQLKIPDYFTVIKHPMDLGTVKRKLLSGAYAEITEFAADVRLTFTNAMTYNPPGNDVHFMAKTMSKFFEMRWKPIEKKITPNPPNPSVIVETDHPTPLPPPKKPKSTPGEKSKPENVVKQTMSDAERLKLSADLEPLLSDLPDNIVDFLKQSSANASKGTEDELNKDTEDEIEIDFEALSDDTLITLRKLIDDYLLHKQENESKDPQTTEFFSLQLHDVSGLSTSRLEPEKGNDPAEEEVDIGVNDPPISSFPPVEIDKDSVRRNSKPNSSSSSSSASDSDTGSSSSGDSGMAKRTAPEETPKGILGSGVNFDQRTATNPETEDALNGMVRQNTGSTKAVEPNLNQEAESAPPESKVSPEKLYRAAILRSRFADTIIKAKEKTLEKGDKDPEKLRIEREEMERLRKLEKARLQAEAKAAEEARRKAEEAAAAEARRKRELEREAARQALQNMEKTVDINENSQFMEDLEMFRSAPDENLASFMDETSPDHSLDALGSFKFQGSNPLEKLGLYMKKDDEEEEEPEAPGVPETSNGPADGEIDGSYIKKENDEELEATCVTETSNGPEDGEIDGLYIKKENDDGEEPEAPGVQEASNDPEEGEID